MAARTEAITVEKREFAGAGNSAIFGERVTIAALSDAELVLVDSQ